MSEHEPDRSTERQSDLAVMDANEFKNKHRLDRILRAHDNVEEVKSAADQELVAGEINEQGRNLVVLWAVQRHLRQIYNLLRDYHEALDDGEEDVYLEGVPERPIGRIEFEHQDDQWFIGLGDILHAQDTYVESWTETVKARHGVDRKKSRTEHHTVPKHVSLRAYLRAKQFLSEEHDLDIQFEELNDDLTTWGFEEVPDEEGTEATAPAARGVADGDD